MRTLTIKEYMVGFNNLKSGLCQAIVTNSTDLLPIYLLFEPEKIDLIENRLKTIAYKENLTLEFFKMIVAGCIQTCMKEIPKCQ